MSGMACSLAANQIQIETCARSILKADSTQSRTNAANSQRDVAESNHLSALRPAAKAFHGNRLRLNYTPFRNDPLPPIPRKRPGMNREVRRASAVVSRPPDWFPLVARS